MGAITRNMEKRIRSEWGELAEGILNETLLNHLEWVREYILPKYIQYDIQAVYAKKRYRMLLTLVQLFSVLAVVTVVSQTLFMPEFLQLIWLEVALIISLLFGVLFGNRRAYLDVWCSNRYKAERCRFLIISLMFERKEEHHHILANRVFELLRGGKKFQFSTEGKPAVNGTDCFQEIKQIISNKYMKSQVNYHKNVIKRTDRILREYGIVSILLLGFTLLAAVLHALGIGHHTDGHGEDAAWNIWTFIAIIFPAVLAALSAVKNSMEIYKNRDRSSRFLQVLTLLSEELDEATELDALHDLIYVLEEYSLHEQAEWHSIISCNHVEAA